MSNINFNVEDIVWGDPPPPQVSNAKGGPPKRPSNIRQFVATLRLQPGTWAKYPALKKAGYSTAMLRDMGITDCEFTTRRMTDPVTGEKLTATYGRCIPADERQPVS